MTSIEVSHLLGNEPLNEYHFQSYNYFKNKLNGQGCILIDNYNFHFDDYALPFDNLLVFYEADCVKGIPSLLEGLGLSDKDSNLFWKNIQLKRKGRWTCAALTAVWYLSRLGKIPASVPQAESLINILHKKFQPSETKALAIVTAFLKEPAPIINYYWEE